MKQLNFGCGTNIRKDWDNADIIKNFGANLVFDTTKFPYPIKSNTYDYILADNCLEHLPNPEKVIDELVRISKNGAVIEINVPHMNCEGAFNLGHISFWTKHSFMEFEDPPVWKCRKYIIKCISLEIIPTTAAKYIPFKQFFSRFLRGIYSQINFKGKIVKIKN